MYIGNLTKNEFEKNIKLAKCVILPIGSCEQHGNHLPLNTDNFIAEFLSSVVASKTNSLVLPTINYGQVWSARKIPGSISLKNETVKQIVRDIVLSLENLQVQNILIISGHNGNYDSIRETARELNQYIGHDNIWYYKLEVDEEIKNILSKDKNLSIHHAGEMETSIMLYIEPELVKIDKNNIVEVPVIPEEAKYRPISWDKFIKIGSFGNFDIASREKGKKILDIYVNRIIHIINDLMI